MGVVKTNEWLKAYIEEAKQETSIVKRGRLQLQLLVAPMYRELRLREQIEKQSLLLEQGLFPPNEKIEKEVQKLFERRVWHLCASQLKKLQKEWDGPDVRVFLFPANEKQEYSRNGMLYEDRIILFIRSSCKDDEIRALLTHEYHHACRLFHQNFNESTIPLIESIVMEGLAEYAVNEHVGQHVLAPWTKSYSRERLQLLWERTFKKHAELQGRSKHYPYLLGSSVRGVPRLAGYAVGYFLVTEYIKQMNNPSTVDLFPKSAEEIINFLNLSDK